MNTPGQPNSTPLEADYPPEWHSGAIQARIREQAQYTCEICGEKVDPATNRLLSIAEGDEPIFGHVHHLDHYPPNCDDSNLMFVCQNCHIRLHGWGWKPGDEMPLAWNNEPPPWVLRRGLPYRINPAASSLNEAARYRVEKQERARFMIGLIEGQGWIKGTFDAGAEMRAFLRTVLLEYDLILAERTRQAQAPILKQTQEWAQSRGLIAEPEAVRRSGLSDSDFQAALDRGLIAAEACPYADPAIPSVPLYFDPAHVVLPPETIQALWATMRLTRQQAADCLGVSVPIFERMRRRAGFKPVESVRGGDGRFEPVYRRRDVEALRKA
jgi:hypothetical protein